FLLGYGSAACFCEGQDDFDFEDPFHRLRRFKSLYDNSTPITNPIAFLERLHYKAILKSRYPARQTINRLCRLLTEYLDVDTGPWLERACDFGLQWAQLKAWQKRACLPVLDAVRLWRSDKLIQFCYNKLIRSFTELPCSGATPPKGIE
ncbi:MAG: hypothetical protein KJ737_21580, partial [Proteobacteria bacterium]|nr:hypothetical protein [Pseudomonadota bacterium]